MKEDLGGIIEERIRLIKQYLDGTQTPAEEDTFQRWINESPSHEELVRCIQNKESLKKRISSRKMFNKKKSWKDIQKRIQSKKRHRIGLVRYAAIVIIGIFMGLIAYKFIPEPQETKVIQERVAFQKNGYKAFLKLANGTHYTLDNQSKINTRQNGAIIKSEEEGIVSVTRQDSNTVDTASRYNQIIVPRGGEYRVILADGTRVWMNSFSELDFPSQFTGKERRVKLRGEAYFDVTKDAQKPFIVEIEDKEVKVLGTTFNINNYDGKFTTTLVTGKVQVSFKGEEYTLQPSMQLQLEDGKVVLSEVDTKEFIAWKEGWFIFKKQRLEEVLKTLSRWYDMEVIYQDEDVKDLHFTGTIQRHSDVYEVTKFIEKTGAAKFTITGKSMIISKE